MFFFFNTSGLVCARLCCCPQTLLEFNVSAHIHTPYLEESFEHDVYDLVLLIDVVQLYQILERIQLIFSLGLKQPLV